MDRRINLHTHCYRCKHASDNVRDYAEAAWNKDFTHLGMTDHVPLPDDWWSGIRMHMSEMDFYLKDIDEARAEFPALRILSGFECDYYPEYEEYLESLYPRVNYLIGSVHSIRYKGKRRSIYDVPKCPETLQLYADLLCEAMASRLFRFIAHPDLFSVMIRRWNRDCEMIARQIFETCKQYSSTLEINTSGYRKARGDSGDTLYYPIVDFWRVAGEYGVKVVVNSDAHTPEDVDADLDAGYELASRFALPLDLFADLLESDCTEKG